jgi:hypothetical protein
MYNNKELHQFADYHPNPPNNNSGQARTNTITNVHSVFVVVMYTEKARTKQSHSEAQSRRETKCCRLSIVNKSVCISLLPFSAPSDMPPGVNDKRSE